MTKTINFCPECGTPVQFAEAFGQQRQVCPNCDYVHFVDPKVAACTFITQDDKVLLVKRGVLPEMGKWALPAGYIDYGEDPAHAAIRETQEETGLIVEITSLLDVTFYQGNHFVIVIIYAARPIGGELLAADDALEAAWFTATTLPEVAFESTKSALKRWQMQKSRF